jgi:cytochrome P450
MWQAGYRLFAITGTATPMAVAPMQNTLFTCDPKLIAQLLRDPALGSPTALLSLLNVFGPTMTGTDGPENKLYRKVMAPYITSAAMERVFRESVVATVAFVQIVGGRRDPVDAQLRPMLSKLALHILGRCGFDKEGSCVEELQFAEKAPGGHQLSFADTFLGIDQDFPIIGLTPPFLLKHVYKRGHLLRDEMQKYLEEAVKRKRVSMAEKELKNKNLLDLLVEAGDQDGVLSKEQVTARIFILQFAGHESNVHALQFALLKRACQPELQARVQRDIDRILGHLPPENWSYYTALAQSMMGSVINESLRVYTVLPVFVKETMDNAVSVTLEGRRHVIPPITLIVVNTSATHRNPAYWEVPLGTPREGGPYAVSSFNPEQWLDRDGKFLAPEPGSYIPFSDGPRGCIGQRFAMVELCVSLAMILKDHRIELAATSGDETETAEVQE